MLDSARRRAHEGIRRDPTDLDAWVDLARAVRQGGDPPTELTPADFSRLLEALRREPSARDLAELALAALGVEAAAPRFPATRWKAPDAVGEDDRGPYEVSSGMPLAAHHPGLSMDFRWIPAGRYALGSLPADSVTVETSTSAPLRPREVQRTRVLPVGFYLATTPVTQAQYRELTGESPSFRRGDDRPVERLRVEDADTAAGLAESRRGGAAIGWSLCLPDGERWEIALRGAAGPRGASTREGWFRENARGVTHPVGELAPGPHGTVDQFGNVSEWCTDVDRSLGPARADGGRDPLELRMTRGGDWTESPRMWTVSRFVFRIISHPYGRPRASVGMRLMLGPSLGTVSP